MPTADWSTADIIAGIVNVDQRVSLGLNEIVRRLQVKLPDVIATLNTQLGYPTNQGITCPDTKNIRVGMSALEDEKINCIFVTSALKTTNNSPLTFRNEASILIYSIDSSIRTGRQNTLAFERAGAIRGCLYPFVNGCQDLSDRWCWNNLLPQGVSGRPIAWANNEFGTESVYSMWLQPEGNPWSS